MSKFHVNVYIGYAYPDIEVSYLQAPVYNNPEDNVDYLEYETHEFDTSAEAEAFAKACAA